MARSQTVFMPSKIISVASRQETPMMGYKWKGNCIVGCLVGSLFVGWRPGEADRTSMMA